MQPLKETSSEQGRKEFAWAKLNMPVFRLALEFVKRDIRKSRRSVLRGLSLCASLHVSKETSVLIHALKTLDVEVYLVAANPLSSNESIVRFLLEEGVKVEAKRGETAEEYKSAIEKAAKSRPELIVDDGAELHVAYVMHGQNSCFGGTDETTSGTMRLKALADAHRLSYPIIAVNEATTKHLFDNRFGTGQSAIDGLLRGTGLLIAGKRVVVAGYGWVGKGVAERAKGMGAKVIVTEVDPVKALEAHLEGFELMSMEEAAVVGDIFLTCTGQVNVISKKDFQLMKNGAILGNVGHFDREIDVKSLLNLGTRIEQVKGNIAKIKIGKKSIYLLTQGRVINLAAGEGHPPEIMQMSFANQLLSLYYLAKNRGKMVPGVYDVPGDIDRTIAKLAIDGFGLNIDRLSPTQIKYSRSF